MARAKDVKAKEKKQKLILGGLGVVLLIVLAIELPGMLSSGGSTSSSTTTTATVATAPDGSPVPAAVAPAGAAVASSEVVFSTSVQKLSHLGFFKAKDPFESHGVGATPTAASTSPPAAAAPTSPPAAAATGNAAAKAAAAAAAAGAISSGPIFGTIQGPSSQSSGPSQGAGSRSARSIPSAVIRFNGHPQTVALGASFPKKSPYFRLAGVTPNGIIISVLKGSLADGSASIELVKNRPLTLVNTATGGRFRIELRSVPKKT